MRTVLLLCAATTLNCGDNGATPDEGDPVVEIVTGAGHACALTSSGVMKCWGSDGAGALGNGYEDPPLPSPVPVVPTGLPTPVSAIAAGGHTCALVAGAGVWCWGGNGSGQLGPLAGTESHIPSNVPGLTSGVVAVAVGGFSTYALMDTGQVKSWGSDNEGQLGDGGENTDRAEHADVVGLPSDVVKIAAGGLHACALTSGGAVYCWGYNYHGQIGDGTGADKPTAVAVDGLTEGVVAIAAGGSHSCAVLDTGGVKCWGTDVDGQVGDGASTAPHVRPTDVEGLSSGVLAVSAAIFHTCALLATGAVKCWGGDFAGALGNGEPNGATSSPVDVLGLTEPAIAISSGGAFSCALLESGQVACWGDNMFGQVGTGATSDGEPLPVTVVGL